MKIMNKNIIVIIIVVFIIAAVGTVVFLKRSQPNSATLTTKTTNTSDTGGKKSVDSSTSSGVSLKCTFSQKETESSGTLYLNGPKQQRTDTLSLIGGNSAQGHIIYDGEYVYMWTEWIEKDGRKMVTGTKSASKDVNAMADQAQSQFQKADNLAQVIELNKQHNIDCSPWVVDESKFILPSGVEFIDITSNPNNMKEVRCNTCNSYPVEAQAQCKATLKCD
jgi:uncharacterized membrane protein